MERFQKIMLAVTAGMLVFFSILMAVLHFHPGVAFEEGLLKIQEYEDRTIYSGKAHGTPVTITVTCPTNFQSVVDVTIGTEIHDVCEVEYPLAPIETERGYTVNGIRVTKNSRVIFEGGYDPEGGDFARWFEADGSFHFPLNIRAYASGNPWYSYEVTYQDAARFAFGPETSVHGDPAFFAMAVFLSILLAVRVVFWEGFFRFEHRWARDPEPTEGYLTLEHAGWVILAVVAAGFYIAAMTKIY